MNFYQRAKSQSILSFPSRDIANLKILQSEWLRAFWIIPQEPDSFQICHFYRNIENNINFYYRPNAEKLMNNIFNNFKKKHFLTYFGLVFGKNFFFQKSGFATF